MSIKAKLFWVAIREINQSRVFRTWMLFIFILFFFSACTYPIQTTEYPEPEPEPEIKPEPIPELEPEPKPVEIKPSPPRQAPLSVQSDLPSIPYTIQVGAFSTTARAANFASGLQNMGLDAYYFIDKDGLYKVRFGRFAAKRQARQHALKLQSVGQIGDFYVVQPSTTQKDHNSQLALRNSIVQTARRFIGTSYRWGGESARSGFDCSGLTMTVYRLNGLGLPRNSRSQFRAGSPIARRQLKSGDLVFFTTNGRGSISHVGIYIGQGQFIHAPGRGKRIRTSSLGSGYFNKRYKGGRRYF